MQVRDAKAGEGRSIAEIRIASWRAVYRGLMPQELLDSMSVESGATRFEQSIAEDPEGSALLVVEEQGEVRGFAALGPDREGKPGRGELYAIYLDPSWFRRGAGTELMEEAVRRFRHWGHVAAILWVLDTNRPARLFYEAMGWRTDGLTKVDSGFGHPLVEVAYTRPL